MIKSSLTEFVGERMPTPKDIGESFLNLAEGEGIIVCTDQIAQWMLSVIF